MQISSFSLFVSSTRENCMKTRARIRVMAVRARSTACEEPGGRCKHAAKRTGYVRVHGEIRRTTYACQGNYV
jgi:hypothetical protein